MLEAETSFIAGLSDVMDLVEGLVRHLVATAAADESAAHFRSIDPSLSEIFDQASTTTSSWPRLSYTDAISLLSSRHATEPFAFKPAWGDSLHSEHEKWLAETHFRGPVFVTDYPATIKPFYMRPNDDDDKKTVACFDLLVPRAGELVGGSMREERLDRLVEKIRAAGMPEEEYEWYLDLRKYGTTMHGGFGLGWERLVSWLTGVNNLRECIAFPRAHGSSESFVA
jgi:asparaginyl-tRNA synthetase